MSVSSFLFPMLYTIFLWWFGTGIILLLNQRPRSTHQATFWMSGMVLLFALVGLKTSANLNTWLEHIADLLALYWFGLGKRLDSY